MSGGILRPKPIILHKIRFYTVEYQAPMIPPSAAMLYYTHQNVYLVASDNAHRIRENCKYYD